MGLLADLKRRLLRTPPEPLASLPRRLGQNVVTRGRVVARDLIPSPLTEERCIYYRYLVEEWHAGADVIFRGGNWRCIDRDEAIAEFYVDDGTGRVLVLPAPASVTVDGGRSAPVPMPHGQRAFESRIGPGDLVEVEGVADVIDDVLDQDRGYREEATRITMRACDGGTLRIKLL